MEKRSYSRVATSITGVFRLVSEDSDQPLYLGGFYSSLKNTEHMLQQAGLPEALTQFLINIDTKLDVVLGQQQKETLRETFPHLLYAAEISGSGLLFHTDEPLQVEQVVEIVLFLRQYPLTITSVMGHIVRVDNAEKNVYALKFTTISDNDLRHIVAFVFDQERRIIRQQRRD